MFSRCADLSCCGGATAKDTAQFHVIILQTLSQRVEVCQAFFIRKTSQPSVIGAFVNRVFFIDWECGVVTQRLGMRQHLSQDVEPLFHVLEEGRINNHAVACLFSAVKSNEIQGDQVFVGIQRDRRVSEPH